MRQDLHQLLRSQQTQRLESLIGGVDSIGRPFITVLQARCLILKLPSGLDVLLA